MSDTTPTPAEIYDQNYRDRVACTVRRLREAADDFERRALDVRVDLSHLDGVGAYSAAANTAIDAYTSGLANAKPGSIVGPASAADQNLLREKQGDT